MFRVSCFADEFSPDLEEQIRFLRKNGIRYVELRSVWEKNVLDLSDSELDLIKDALDENEIRLSSIASPIGKVDISDDFNSYLGKYQRALDIARKMDTNYIRIFSFYMAQDCLDQYRDEVIRRLRIMTAMAEEKGITLLHENEAGIYGESSDRCLELFEAIDSPCLKAVFDPGNFIMAGEDVFKGSYQRLKDHIAYVHVKDTLKESRQIVIAGQGDGDIKEIMNALRDQEDMFVSLEPHLAFAGKYKGFTGPEMFQQDVDAFIMMLDELNIGRNR